MSKRVNISNWKKELDERFEIELYQVGTRLSDERKKNNLTQTEAAKLMEIGRQSVSDHERGKHLTIARLNKYADVYGCHVERFFVDEPNEEGALQKHLDEKKVMKKIMVEIHPFFAKRNPLPVRFLDEVSLRTLERWEKFAKEEVPSESNIKSMEFTRYKAFAAELDLSLHELLFAPEIE